MTSTAGRWPEDASSADLREVLKAQTVVIHRLQDRVMCTRRPAACMVTLSQKQEAQKRQLQRIDARLDTIFKQITEGHNRVEDLQESTAFGSTGMPKILPTPNAITTEATRSTFNTMHDRITRAESAVSVWTERMAKMEEVVALRLTQRGLFNVTPVNRQQSRMSADQTASGSSAAGDLSRHPGRANPQQSLRDGSSSRGGPISSPRDGPSHYAGRLKPYAERRPSSFSPTVHIGGRSCHSQRRTRRDGPYSAASRRRAPNAGPSATLSGPPTLASNLWKSTPRRRRQMVINAVPTVNVIPATPFWNAKFDRDRKRVATRRPHWTACGSVTHRTGCRRRTG